MYAAKLQLGWFVGCFEGKNATEIIRRAEEIQEFGCILYMGRSEENEEGQKELDKLEKFLDKYYEGNLEMSDIESLDINLSIATISCLGIADGEEEIRKLKEG